MTMSSPFELLEMNVISAQELPPVSKSVRAYAVAWLHPDRKLATQIDEQGHTNPTWNEKFVFRVDDDHVLNSVITIQIYASACLRHVLVGTVSVLVSNLLPPNPKPKLRFVALQIRPQGILNIAVTLLDTTMPLCSQLTHDENNSPFDSELLSEKNDSTINDYTYHGNAKQGNGYYGYDDGQDSEVGVRKGGFFNEDSLCSDVGPSPSVVAAAIAKGLYPMPPPPPRTAESSTIDGWSENNSTGTEGMKTKIERWRTELTPAYEDYDGERKKVKETSSKRVGQTPRRGGPCSCFGTVFGCQISITYGGGNRRKRLGGGKGRVTTAASELTFDDSYI